MGGMCADQTTGAEECQSHAAGKEMPCPCQILGLTLGVQLTAYSLRCAMASGGS